MWAKIKGIEFEVRTKEDLELLVGGQLLEQPKVVEEKKVVKKHSFKVKRNKRPSRAFKMWTKSDDKVLKSNSPVKAKKLLGRSISAIYLRRHAIGVSDEHAIIPSRKKYKRLTDTDKKYILANLGIKTIREMGEYLGRSPSTIHTYVAMFRKNN